MKKLYILSAGILFAALIGIHFLWLDRFPVGLSHDEAEYVLSSKTFFRYGYDLSGVRFPLSIFRTGTLGIISPAPYIILSPYFGLIQLNLFTARFPYAILNLLTGMVIFFLTFEFSKKKDVAIVSLLVFLVNPWSFYFSRTAFEVSFALFFYCLGILSLLKYSGKKLIVPFILFIFGFLSYQGAQPLLPFLVTICLIYKSSISKSKSIIRNNYIFLISMIIFFVSYLLISSNTKGSIISVRSSGLIFSDRNNLSSLVNDSRRLSVENPFIYVFNNKATAIANIFVEKYLSAFSPDILFLQGDLRATYRFAEHGLFFLVDIIFLGVGLFGLFQKQKKIFFLLISIILIAPISTSISSVETSVINRSFMLLPAFIILISFGILYVFKMLSERTNRVFAFGILFCAVLFSFLKFLVFYFFKFPVIAHENYFMSERIISNYLLKNGLNNPSTVVANEPRQLFLQTVFYSYSYPGYDLLSKDVLSNLFNGNYKLKNITFVNNCPQDSEDANEFTIAQISLKNCLSQKPKFSINEDHYGGALFLMNDNPLCGNYSNERWKRSYFVSDYQIENLSVPEFCNRWIFLQ